jgi:glucose/arabinose dehydrogenase
LVNGILQTTSFVARYNVSADKNIADATSIRNVFQLKKPEANHNGGQLLFGPHDGYLYIFLGDGGGAGDPNRMAQNKTFLFGKILRVDPKTGAHESGYNIPPDNPFLSNEKDRKEIFHLGVRNPWRNSFDKTTGDLYIGDVGQDRFEEISLAPAGSKGLNFGWSIREGLECFRTPNCKSKGLTKPILTYSHGATGECAVTGGYMYRGRAIPKLVGKYVYGDFCTAKIMVGTKGTSWTSQQLQVGLSISLSSFGQDHDGELYVCDLVGGAIYKLAPAT